MQMEIFYDRLFHTTQVKTPLRVSGDIRTAARAVSPYDPVFVEIQPVPGAEADKNAVHPAEA